MKNQLILRNTQKKSMTLKTKTQELKTKMESETEFKKMFYSSSPPMMYYYAIPPPRVTPIQSPPKMNHFFFADFSHCVIKEKKE